jgi:hypothetical protein
VWRVVQCGASSPPLLPGAAAVIEENADALASGRRLPTSYVYRNVGSLSARAVCTEAESIFPPPLSTPVGPPAVSRRAHRRPGVAAAAVSPSLLMLRTCRGVLPSTGASASFQRCANARGRLWSSRDVVGTFLRTRDTKLMAIRSRVAVHLLTACGAHPRTAMSVTRCGMGSNSYRPWLGAKMVTEVGRRKPFARLRSVTRVSVFFVGRTASAMEHCVPSTPSAGMRRR